MNWLTDDQEEDLRASIPDLEITETSDGFRLYSKGLGRQDAFMFPEHGEQQELMIDAIVCLWLTHPPANIQ